MLTVGDYLSMASLLVGVVGFSLTILQLRRTANATETANRLLENVADRMQHNHLLVLLPQLHVIADELDAAVVAENEVSVTRALVAYSRVAVQIAAMLEQSSSESDGELSTRLRATAHEATEAKSEIVSGTDQPFRKLLHSFMLDISDISNVAGGLVSTYQMKVS